MMWLINLIIGTIIGRIVTIGLGAGLVSFGAYYLGNQRCAANVQLAEAQAEIAQLKFEKNALDSVLRTERALNESAQQEDEERRVKVGELEDLLKARKEKCPVAATSDEMRAIERIQ